MAARREAVRVALLGEVAAAAQQILDTGATGRDRRDVVAGAAAGRDRARAGGATVDVYRGEGAGRRALARGGCARSLPQPQASRGCWESHGSCTGRAMAYGRGWVTGGGQERTVGRAHGLAVLDDLSWGVGACHYRAF